MQLTTQLQTIYPQANSSWFKARGEGRGDFQHVSKMLHTSRDLAQALCMHLYYYNKKKHQHRLVRFCVTSKDVLKLESRSATEK